MFGIDIKQIFKEKIYDLLIILCIIHLVSVMFSYLFKWIHPYVKNYAVMQSYGESSYLVGKITNASKKHQESESRNNKNSLGPSNFEESKIINNSVLEYLQVEGLQSFHSVSPDLSENSSKNVDSLSDLSFEIEKVLSLKRFIKDHFKKRKSSCEAQTNITISPKLKIDYSCPNRSLLSKVVAQKSESTDSFQSAYSHLENEDQKFDNIWCTFEYCDIQEQTKRKGQTHTEQRIGNVDSLDIKKCSFVESRKFFQTNEELMSSPFSISCEKKTCQENKILELAINEFEKELKPIRDQIKVLKDCLDSFDSDATPSDMSSSVTETFPLSECLSTTCSTDITSFNFKSFEIPLEKNNDSLKAEEYYQNKGSLDRNPTLLSTSSNNDCKNGSYYKCKYPDECQKGLNISEARQHSKAAISKKRSPLAEMYVKLSQSNLPSNPILKHKKCKSQVKVGNKNLTCQINLNFNVEALSSSNCQKKLHKDRNIQPLLSEPEEIFGEPSHTHISLKPAKCTKSPNNFVKL